MKPTIGYVINLSKDNTAMIYVGDGRSREYRQLKKKYGINISSAKHGWIQMRGELKQ